MHSILDAIRQGIKLLPICLSLASAGVGVWAALLWWKASKTGPIYEGTEPGTFEGSQNWQRYAIDRGMIASARLNASAALWTGVASFLSACAAVAGWLTSS